MKKLLAILLCLAALAGCFAFAVSANGDEASLSIKSAELNKKGNSLTVALTADEKFLAENKGESFCLLKLESWESTENLAGKQPLDEAELKKSELTFKCGFEELTDRFCSYVAAKRTGDGYTPVSEVRYVDNLSILADDTSPYPEYDGKKGLVADDDARVLLTGASHTVIRVNADELLLSTSTTDSSSFVYGGMTYYLSQSGLSALDRKVRFLSDSGVNIFLQITLSGKYRGSGDRLECLYYPEAPDGASGYALNSTSSAAMAYYTAFIDYLTDRYDDPDEYGRIGSWIVGCEVDTNSLSNAAGEMWMAEYCDSYSRVLRTTYASAVSRYASARVYVSVSNSWNARANNSSAVYNASLFLVNLTSKMRAEGDFGWRVAVSARPSDPSLARIWEDTAAEGSDYVTMNNLSLLTDALGRDNLSYNGEARRVAVTDFASASDPAAPTDMTQAAAYAYAYHAALFNDSVDALIYSVLTDETSKEYVYPVTDGGDASDTQDEPQMQTGTLCLGMIDSNGIEKPLYDLFCNIDAATPHDPEYKDGKAASFALSYAGLSDWRELCPEYSAEETASHNLAKSLSILSESIPSKLKATEIADFEKGDFGGFYAAAGGAYTELRTVENADGLSSAMLYAGLTTNGGRENMGVTCRLDSMSSRKAEYVSFDIFVEAPLDVTSVEVILTLCAPDSSETDRGLFLGTSTVKPNEWQEVTFCASDLTAVSETLDTLGIWISSYDGQDHEGSWAVVLDNVTAYGKSSSAFGKIVGTILLVIFVLFVLLVAALFALRVYNVRRIKKRRAELARRRAIAQRRARMTGQGVPPQNRPNYPNNPNNMQ
ncbi:MAG: hypothetical protein IJC50_04535 [Clostridia bacterium]|nr:hypothetical protein [Clostridia bacterium]